MIRLAFLALAAMFLPTAAAHANGHFTDQAIPATGKFEWHTFSGAYSNAHVPNDSAGIGVATLTGESIALPGPPQFPSPLIDGGSLYSGGRLGRFPVSLTGASTASGAFTTVVLQVAADANSSTFINSSTLLLDGAAPTSFIDRGIAIDNHQYYWASWQVAADADFGATFESLNNHFALSGAQLDYFNGAVAFNAVVPGVVPEPSTFVLAGLGVAIAACRLAQRRRAEKRSPLR